MTEIIRHPIDLSVFTVPAGSERRGNDIDKFDIEEVLDLFALGWRRVNIVCSSPSDERPRHEILSSDVDATRFSLANKEEEIFENFHITPAVFTYQTPPEEGGVRMFELVSGATLWQKQTQ